MSTVNLKEYTRVGLSLFHYGDDTSGYRGNNAKNSVDHKFYRYYPSGLGNWTSEFRLKNYTDGNGKYVIWAIGQEATNPYSWQQANGYGVYLYGIGKDTLRLECSSNGFSDEWTGLETGTFVYYLTIERISGVVYCRIYSDSGRNNLITELTVEIPGTSYYYHLSGSTWNDGSSLHGRWTVGDQTFTAVASVHFEYDVPAVLNLESNESYSVAWPIPLTFNTYGFRWTEIAPPDITMAVNEDCMITTSSEQATIHNKDGSVRSAAYTRHMFDRPGAPYTNWVENPFTFYDPDSKRFFIIATSFVSSGDEWDDWRSWVRIFVSKNKRPRKLADPYWDGQGRDVNTETGIDDWHRLIVDVKYQLPADVGSNDGWWGNYVRAGANANWLILDFSLNPFESGLEGPSLSFAFEKGPLLDGVVGNYYNTAYQATLDNSVPAIQDNSLGDDKFITAFYDDFNHRVYMDMWDPTALDGNGEIDLDGNTRKYVDVTDGDLAPNVPQDSAGCGGSPVEYGRCNVWYGNDDNSWANSRMSNPGVVRDGHLYVANTIADPLEPTKAIVRWYEIDITNFETTGPVLVQKQDYRIGDDHSFVPALALSVNKDKLIISCMTGGDDKHYGAARGVYWGGKYYTDVYAPGEDCYYPASYIDQDYPFLGTMSGISLDPTMPEICWAANAYAKTRESAIWFWSPYNVEGYEVKVSCFMFPDPHFIVTAGGRLSLISTQSWGEYVVASHFTYQQIPSLTIAGNSTAFPLEITFEGTDYEESYPPDPIMAVSEHCIITCTNDDIAIYNKDGSLRTEMRADYLWYGTNTSYAFDPYVIFDHHSKRFFLIYDRIIDSEELAYIWLAVSTDDNPQDENDWYIWKLDVTYFDGTNNTWNDYPKIGTNDDCLFLTGNYFPFGNGPYHGGFICIEKAPLLVGDPVNILHEEHLDELITLFPLMHYGISGKFYFGMTDGPPYLKIYEFAYTLVGGSLVPTPTLVPETISVSDWWEYSTTASQPDTCEMTGLSTVYERIMGGMVRGDTLWMTHGVADLALVDPLESPRDFDIASRWYEIDITNYGGTGATITQEGNIYGAGSPGKSTFMPSIVANANNHVAIGFSIVGRSEGDYGSAGYTDRTSAMASGTTNSIITYAPGLGCYEVTDYVGRNRWGDYSAICLDPCIPDLFWVYNEYAFDDTTWKTKITSFLARPSDS